MQIPVPESRYSSLHAVKGGLVWLKEPISGNLGEGGANLDDAAPRAALERFDFAQQRSTELHDEVDWFEVSGDGCYLVVSDHGDLSVVPADRKPDSDNPSDRVGVDLSRARYLAQPAALWRNAYEEAGRILRHDYWVPDMAEVDWDGVLAAYRPLLDRIAGPGDFADLLWEVLGELGTSHAYVAPAGGRRGGGGGKSACSARIWSWPGTAAGGSPGCCRGSPRTRGRARRWRAPGPASARATPSSPWTGSRSARPVPGRCWWARPESRSS